MADTPKPDDLTEQEQEETHDTQEEYKDTLRPPGLWLDEPMSQQEIDECIDLYHKAKAIDGGTPADSGDTISNTINKCFAPSDQQEALLKCIRHCMNSLIHLFYLSKKDEEGLEAAEGAIFCKGDKSEEPFDIYPSAIKNIEGLAIVKDGLTKFIEATLTSKIANEAITEDAVRQPGLWLEEPLTDKEIDDVDKMQKVLLELILKKENDLDKVIDAATPYLNSLMHMIYLLFKDFFHIEAVEDGVICHKSPDDEELYFDIVAYTVDFALDNFFMLEDKEAGKGEFYNAEEMPGTLQTKGRQIKDRVERIKSYIEKKTKQEEKLHHRTRKAQAVMDGAITTIGKRLFLPSDPEYQDALISRINENQRGLFYRGEDGKNVSLPLETNMPLIYGLAKAVFIDNIYNDYNVTVPISDRVVKIYLPNFFNELEYSANYKPPKKKLPEGETAIITEMPDEAKSSRSESRSKLLSKFLDSYEHIWGILPDDDTEYKLCSIYSYEPKTEVINLTSPYLQALMDRLLKKEVDTLETGKHFYYYKCDLLHSSAANERNQAAFELASRVLVGVQQRGLKPDVKLKQNKNKGISDDTLVTYKVSCRNLIDRCPQLKDRLDTLRTTSEKTQTIQRTFKAMYKILKKKSDLYSCYLDVKVNEVIPTCTSLESLLIITHHGGNPKYIKPDINPITATTTDEDQKKAEQ